eukprot:g28364.t1
MANRSVRSANTSPRSRTMEWLEAVHVFYDSLDYRALLFLKALNVVKKNRDVAGLRTELGLSFVVGFLGSFGGSAFCELVIQDTPSWIVGNIKVPVFTLAWYLMGIGPMSDVLYALGSTWPVAVPWLILLHMLRVKTVCTMFSKVLHKYPASWVGPFFFAVMSGCGGSIFNFHLLRWLYPTQSLKSPWPIVRTTLLMIALFALLTCPLPTLSFNTVVASALSWFHDKLPANTITFAALSKLLRRKIQDLQDAYVPTTPVPFFSEEDAKSFVQVVYSCLAVLAYFFPKNVYLNDPTGPLLRLVLTILGVDRRLFTDDLSAKPTKVTNSSTTTVSSITSLSSKQVTTDSGSEAGKQAATTSQVKDKDKDNFQDKGSQEGHQGNSREKTAKQKDANDVDDDEGQDEDDDDNNDNNNNNNNKDKANNNKKEVQEQSSPSIRHRGKKKPSTSIEKE